MKGLTAIRLHGLQAQVLLWTILPLIIFLIIFSVTGISSHQNSMHALAAEENTRLVVALARAIALQINNYNLRFQTTFSEVPIEVLELDQLLEVEHPDVIVTFALIDAQGKILFSKGLLPAGRESLNWTGVSQALAGERGAIFEPETGEGDVIAFAPVPGTSWALMLREPWHSLTVPLLRFEQATPLILLAAIVISLSILYFGLRFVVQPLRRLGMQASEIGQGNFDAAAKPVSGVKEIEDLRETMNQMAHRIQDYQAALQDYLHATTQSQEEERARLGRELHDETVQTLIALDHKAQIIQRGSEGNSAQSAERATELRRMIGAAIEEVRRFSRALRPIYLEELGLVPALELLAQEAEAKIRISGSPSRLRADQELALYRIAQESFNNAKRHAKAQHLWLELSFAEPAVMLRIGDDGVGFEIPSNLSELTRTGHFGLMGMRERAQLIGGQMNVSSSPKQGTTVTVTLPK